MFEVLGVTVEVCHRQQCLLANCSRTEHQQFIFCVLVYFLLFVLSCQYQCKWLPGKTRLQSDLLCVERDVW